jgi:predicted alpha/beta hydrolase
MTIPHPHPRTVATPNGFKLQANFFHPQNEMRASVLIVPAMGVKQTFYAPLAAWLAEQGYLAVTFDYSGIGLSGSGALRKLDVDILGWALNDCVAMLDAVVAAAPEVPLYWIGHSLGGQVLGLLPDRSRIARAVTIAVGSGYWRENSASTKWKAAYLWYVVVPLVTRLCGYFPGKRLRKVGDLPRGVIEQWRRWCLDPDYLVGAEGEMMRAQFAAVETPITSLSFVDDEMMSVRNTESLHSFYVNAPRRMKRIAPQEIGATRIGHFGFFKSQFKDSLWQNYLLPELV